jgi:hypothetical protein
VKFRHEMFDVSTHLRLAMVADKNASNRRHDIQNIMLSVVSPIKKIAST